MSDSILFQVNINNASLRILHLVVSCKMTMISQDEIVSNAKTVTKGLEALRQEHESILGGIRSSLEHTDLGTENSLIQGCI